MNTQMQTLEAKDVLVRAQETPNPYAIKFIVNQTLKSQGKATINDPAELPDSKLVRDLFSIPGVKQIYFFQNTLTVTHEGLIMTDELVDQVIPVIQTRLPVHDPHFDFGEEVVKKPKDRSHLSSELQQIEEILDHTIRPGLQADGGDIEVISLEGNELRILYQGACGGCPSSMMGTLDAIQGILQNELGRDDLMVIPL